MNIFDGVDTFYLANTLTLPQLRHEIHAAEVNQAVANHFLDNNFPWGDFIGCCREAIQWQQAKPRANIPLPHGYIDLEALKAKRDIVREAERYTTLKKSGTRFIGRCPLHEDRHPSLVIYPDQQSWHCFQCDKGGDVIGFIMAVENMDFRGAAAILGGR